MFALPRFKRIVASAILFSLSPASSRFSYFVLLVSSMQRRLRLVWTTFICCTSSSLFAMAGDNTLFNAPVISFISSSRCSEFRCFLRFWCISFSSRSFGTFVFHAKAEFMKLVHSAHNWKTVVVQRVN